MAVTAWLVLLLWMHAWDRDLVDDDHRLQEPAFWVALWLSGAAALLELSLLRHYALDALFRLFVVFGVPLAFVLIIAQPPAASIAIAVVVAPVLAFGPPFARLRVAALLAGGGLTVATWDEYTFGFPCSSMCPWPAHVARSMVSQHHVILTTLLVSAAAFGTALRKRRTRGLGTLGLVVCVAAVSLELLSTTAHRQLREAVMHRPTSWWVDELAGAASVVECLLAGVLAGAAVLVILGVVRRERRFHTRGAAPALVAVALIVLAAQTPGRAIVGWSTPPPVPLASASAWNPPYALGERFPLGAQNVRLTLAGGARTHIGNEPLEEVRVNPHAEVRIWPHRDAPAPALERTLRHLLTQVPEIAVAISVDAEPHVPTPGVDTRVRFMPAAALRPSVGFQRVLRPTLRITVGERPEDRSSCPSASAGESVEHWLQRKPPSCTMRPIVRGGGLATLAATVEEWPRWSRHREPRRPEPLFAAALLGLAAGLFLAHRRIRRDLAPLGGTREPHRGPRRTAATHPSWLWRRDATHWWSCGSTPYRDVAGFHGPENGQAARRLLARRAAHVFWRMAKTGLVWCGILTALAGASFLWSLSP